MNKEMKSSHIETSLFNNATLIYFKELIS